MSRITKALLIAAVAVMLVGATSAYGYHETWNGWFNSGELTYLGATFKYTEGEGVLRDTTDGDVDRFLVPTVTPSTFTCESGEWEGYYIKLWPGASGWKYTGQSEQKEAYDGGWTGFARLYIPFVKPDTFNVEGTWDTDDFGDYFSYGGIPPIYSAEWDITNSDLDRLDGAGGSEGERVYPE
ncbi:MAG: hypothetical protein E3J71_03830 [Candidatus Stahlbacteria bacterium]|nr:MAG: hypothetical protein E3J71_03830 [Candidatus Stahlbacteria bacterium]